jgi:tetratricopeptide (TPR) repeat protein
MVLPPPPPHDELPPRDAGWIEHVKLGLRLSGAQGILIHVDRAVPERLGDLVRGLIGDHPDIDVHVDLLATETVPEGSAMVLIVRPEHAVPLNLGRPIFARRRLKVVLWCDQEATTALIEQAPDFFDWVSSHHECPPPEPAASIVAGLRAAGEAGACVVWHAKGLKSAFEAAFPGEALVSIDQTSDYEALVDAVRQAKGAWIWARTGEPTHMRRLRWAIAEAGRRGRGIVVGGTPGPRWWPVDAYPMTPYVARHVLEKAGASHPGALAALVALEPDAVELARILVAGGARYDKIVAGLREASDPGAAVARMALEEGLVDLESVVAWWPALARRAFPLVAARHAVAELEPADRAIEDRLRGAPSRRSWSELAELARAQGEPRVAELWAERAARAIESERRALLLGAVASAIVGALGLGWGTVERDVRPLPLAVAGAIGVALLLVARRRRKGGVSTTPREDAEADSYRVERLHEVSRALVEEGDYDNALSLIDDALDIELQSERAASPLLPTFLIDLATVLSRRGRARDAEALLRKLLGSDPTLPIADAPPPYRGFANQWKLSTFIRLHDAPSVSAEDRARARRLLGETWITLGRYDEAEHLLERAAPLTDAMAPAHPERWRTLAALARVLALRGRPEQAETTLRRALLLAERHARKDHPDAGRILAQLARVQRRLGRPEASDTAKRALAILEGARIAAAEKQLARADLEPIAAAAPKIR